MSFLTKIFGSSNQRSLKRMQIIVDQINNLESEYQELSDEELSSLREKFKTLKEDNGMISTSDTGYFKNHFLFLTGRSDDVVIKGGENISLSKIKNLLFQHQSIIDLYIETYQDDKIGTVIEVYIELSDTSLSSDDIKDFLSNNLSNNQMPSNIIIVDKIHH